MHHESDLSLLTGECRKAASFTKLFLIAKAEVCKFPGGAEIVCGPITTGGLGTFEENMRVFENTIKALLRQGRPIFNQLPYQVRMVSLIEEWKNADKFRAGKYCMPLIEDFYLPLFKTGCIRRCVVHPRMGFVHWCQMGETTA
jgi:hypothetical protein